MIGEGLTIMGVGMLVVFFFLAIMVISMRSMSGTILRHFPEKEEQQPVRRAAAADDSEVAVAIAAAYTIK